MRRSVILILLTLHLSLFTSAQESDTLAVSVSKSDKVAGSGFRPLKWVLRTYDNISEFLNGCDTMYITPQEYIFTTQAELSYFHDYYYMNSSTSGSDKNMTLQSGNPLSLGAYIYWGPFGFGHSWNLDDLASSSSSSTDNGYRNVFMLNTARFVAEYYTFRSGKNAEFTKISGVELKGDRNFAGLSSRCRGLEAHYIFNNRRYSWPAAFGENAVQKKAAGSFLAGISYDDMVVTFDRNKLSPHIAAQLDTALYFNKVNYTDYGVSLGYCYNWPFRRNCLLAVSLIPTLGYRKSNIEGDDYDYNVLDKVSTDLFLRASLFWNNNKYFSGIVFDMHTYSYREKKFGLTNTYGTLKFIVGFNFLKKSQY